MATPKGYTTATLVAQELGVDLTAPQLDQCADMIAEAEAWIDVETGRAWAVASPTTNELHTLTGRVVYLKNRPTVSISSVLVRPAYVGASNTTLAAGTDYELVDGPNGVLLMSGFLPLSGYPWTSGDVAMGLSNRGSLLSVSYVSSTPVPGDIQRATTMLTAHWMLPRLYPERQGVSSFNLNQIVQTTMRGEDIPDEVMRLIRGRESVMFA